DPSTGDILNVNCLRVARSQGSLFLSRIIALPGRVLWADGTAIKLADTTGASLPFNDLIADTPVSPISGMAVSGTKIYFSDDDPSGTSTSGVIYKAFIAKDQAAIRIARGQN